MIQVNFSEIVGLEGSSIIQEEGGMTIKRLVIIRMGKYVLLTGPRKL